MNSKKNHKQNCEKLRDIKENLVEQRCEQVILNALKCWKQPLSSVSVGNRCNRTLQSKDSDKQCVKFELTASSCNIIADEAHNPSTEYVVNFCHLNKLEKTKDSHQENV